MNKLDRFILELEKRKEMLLALERLSNNKDFDLVINKYFLQEHVINLVMNKGQNPPNSQTNLNIDRQLDCAAVFSQFLEQLISEIPDIDGKISDAMSLRELETRNA